MKGCIYKITNKINNKSYIGQTIQPVKDRWNQHCWKATHSYSENMAIKRAILKYGKENFNFIVIEECAQELLDVREQYWISYYDTFNKGYNLTQGGKLGQRHTKLEDQSDIIIELYKLGFSLRALATEFKCDKKTIRLILTKHDIPLYKTRSYKLSENDRKNLISDYDRGMSRKDLMVKYNIKSKGYLSTILNLYRIKYFHECPDPTLS